MRTKATLLKAINDLNKICKELQKPDCINKDALITDANGFKFTIADILNNQGLLIHTDESARIDGQSVSILVAAKDAIATLDHILVANKQTIGLQLRGIDQSPSLKAKAGEENKKLYDSLIQTVVKCIEDVEKNKTTYKKEEKVQALKGLLNYLLQKQDKNVSMTDTLKELPTTMYYKESIRHRSIVKMYRSESPTKKSLEEAITGIKLQLDAQQSKQEPVIPIPISTAKPS